MRGLRGRCLMPAVELEELVKQWRATRAPELADEIERKAPKLEALEVLWRARTTSQGEAALAAVETLEDPRLTVVLVKCLHAARWPGFGARDLWTRVLARLVALRDARAVFALREAATQPPPFSGIANTRELQALFQQTADALERACQGKLPATPSEFFVRSSKGAAAQSSVELVWAKPDDDAVKRVVADALMEKGEPWGEFIALGLELAGKPKNKAALQKRADALLNKHAQVFGGPIAFIATRDHWVFEKGFLVELWADRSLVPRRRWDDAAHAKHWATVRALHLSSSKAPKWWLGAVLKNPASANLRSISVASVELRRARAGEPWTVERVGSDIGALGWLTAFLRGLDVKERARLKVGDKVGPSGRAELERARVAAEKK
jgi:uncharacterized protein (TIGR02996 family)